MGPLRSARVPRRRPEPGAGTREVWVPRPEDRYVGMKARAKTLGELEQHLSGLAGAAGPAASVRVSGVSHDSRRVRPGDVFVALRGQHTDGHRYVDAAVAAGAAAVVVEEAASAAAVPVPAVLVRDTRRALAELSVAFWDAPSRDLRLVGVTGTNGKTTTTTLVASIGRAAGLRSAVLGTLGLIAEDRATRTEHTTLEAPDLQEALAGLVEEGADLVAIEVSSHGLVLDRVWGTYFDVGAITNVSQDHLDFHESMAEYAAAKGLLFTRYADLARGVKTMRGVINWDDAWARRLGVEARCEVLRYAVESGEAEVRAESIEYAPRATHFDLLLPDGRHAVTTSLVGRFNVENALAAAGCAVALGLPSEAIVQGLAAAEPAPGRLERVEAGQDFLVLVDYCHTPDAVAQVLKEARRLAQGRVLCVIGCGGDRDPSKRATMGAAATELADWTVITSDNPRSEDPAAIIRAIAEGAREGRYETVEDRREAIRRAVDLAQAGDVVLIGGKGHEDYQILGDRTIHFDDREEAREAVLARLAGRPVRPGSQ